MSKHELIIRQLVSHAENDPNILGLLLFGSVAAGTYQEDSDIDVITVLRSGKPAWGIDNSPIDGIKVGNFFLTHEIMEHSVETVPYLLHPFWGAKLLFDRGGRIQPLLERVREYFTDHPDVGGEWDGFRKQFKAEKARYGYEKTTIVDVWNELEKRHSGGRIKRRFFNAFHMTNPLIFPLVKRLLMVGLVRLDKPIDDKTGG
jgi:predicted nucleotidyltransferase